MALDLASRLTPELRELWDGALGALVARRGGVTLLGDVGGEAASADVLSDLVEQHALYVEVRAGDTVGFAVCRHRVIEAIYVVPERRREGVARSMVHSLTTQASAIDAWALPGDRATKSLYEAVGWKARLLTMRAG